MNWSPPSYWVSVNAAAFERIVNERDYRRSGWGGAIVYEDVFTGREFAAMLDAGGYWVHPDLTTVESSVQPSPR